METAQTATGTVRASRNASPPDHDQGSMNVLYRLTHDITRLRGHPHSDLRVLNDEKYRRSL